MASITRRFFLSSRKYPSRIPTHHATPKYAQWQRPLSTTAPRHAKEPIQEGNVTAKAAKASSSTIEETVESQIPQDESAEQLRRLVGDLKNLDPEVVQDAIRKGKHGIPFANDFDLAEDADFEVGESMEDKMRTKAGFWAEGEESMGPDEDYYGDDLTSLGHGELEKHRELREYARLIAWELPLLNQLARPFEPPTTATPFRFRYTSYLGESHPATNKVVVEFSASDMKLSPIQSNKLIKLAGPRYNPSTDIIKISCEDFDTQAQNKRFLGETINRLLAEAKDGKETFEDVPFDFRHHKEKKRYEFPKEWILTPERKKYLEEKRAKTAELEDQKLNNGLLLDGQKIIDTSLPFRTPEPEPVMVSGPRGKQLR